MPWAAWHAPRADTESTLMCVADVSWALCGSGKTVATYQPSMDMGAYVVIVNAEKVVVTGNKFTQKVYTRHTGRPGSRKEETFQKLQAVRRRAAHCVLGPCKG